MCKVSETQSELKSSQLNQTNIDWSKKYFEIVLIKQNVFIKLSKIQLIFKHNIAKWFKFQ